MLSKQAIFDKVVTHLLTQKGRSTRVDYDGKYCAYRGDYGKRCAVGCLISDDAYSPTLESKTVFCVDVREALQASGIPTDAETLDLLRVMQKIHDGNLTSEWRHRLDTYAIENGLAFNPPNEESKVSE